MKYVRLEKAGHSELRFGMAPQTHKDIAAPLVAQGYSPTSAGFLRWTACGKVEAFGTSTSLNLSPAPRDAALITGFYRVTLEMAS